MPFRQRVARHFGESVSPPASLLSTVTSSSSTRPIPFSSLPPPPPKRRGMPKKAMATKRGFAEDEFPDRLGRKPLRPISDDKIVKRSSNRASGCLSAKFRGPRAIRRRTATPRATRLTTQSDNQLSPQQSYLSCKSKSTSTSSLPRLFFFLLCCRFAISML